MSKPMLVGEANPYGGDPAYALYPVPEGSAGERLCCMILGMYRKDYLREFDRVNLCPERWLVKQAKDNAKQYVWKTGGNFILLGSKVCSAFGVKYEPYSSWGFMLPAQAMDAGADRGTVVRSSGIVLPHPSGLCRLWNEPGAVQRARAAVLELCPHLEEFIGKYDAVYANG